MSLLVCLVLVFSSFVAQNKQIAENFKLGYFSVVGVISVLTIVLSIL